MLDFYLFFILIASAHLRDSHFSLVIFCLKSFCSFPTLSFTASASFWCSPKLYLSNFLSFFIFFLSLSQPFFLSVKICSLKTHHHDRRHHHCLLSIVRISIDRLNQFRGSRCSKTFLKMGLSLFFLCRCQEVNKCSK